MLGGGRDHSWLCVRTQVCLWLWVLHCLLWNGAPMRVQASGECHGPRSKGQASGSLGLPPSSASLRPSAFQSAEEKPPLTWMVRHTALGTGEWAPALWAPASSCQGLKALASAPGFLFQPLPWASNLCLLLLSSRCFRLRESAQSLHGSYMSPGKCFREREPSGGWHRR